MARMSSPCSPSVGIESIPRRKNAITRGGKKHKRELPDALRILRQEAEVGGQEEASL